MLRIRFGLTLVLLAFAVDAWAGQAEIVEVELAEGNGVWDVRVTLRHADTGWEHYADAWRVVTPWGRVLGTRTLYHPHVDEQPFTRGLQGVVIPEDTPIVFVEAHDKVHGWNPRRVRVDLTRRSGERFRVTR